MSVRPKNRKTKKVWVVDYRDRNGTRREEAFDRKKDADAFELKVRTQVKEGTHVADSDSKTVQEAGDLWVAAAETAGLEPTSTHEYAAHLRLHIAPVIGTTLVSKLTVFDVRKLEDGLQAKGTSPAMVKKIIGSLGALIEDARESGLVTRNVVRDFRDNRRRRGKRQEAKRQKRKLQVGVDIPLPAEIKAIIGSVVGRWRSLIVTAPLTGLRASELRGLKWENVDFERRVIHVRVRADRFNTFGVPKSAAGQRKVPMPPLVFNTLKALCPKDETGPKDKKGLVFPNGKGNIESLANIMNRGFKPIQVAAGVCVDRGKKDKEGKEILEAKYTGFHTLRHFYASWCINRKADGGLELPAKTVQERMGHATIKETMDTYGHLFPSADDAEAFAAGERALFGV